MTRDASQCGVTIVQPTEDKRTSDVTSDWRTVRGTERRIHRSWRRIAKHDDASLSYRPRYMWSQEYVSVNKTAICVPAEVPDDGGGRNEVDCGNWWSRLQLEHRLMKADIVSYLALHHQNHIEDVTKFLRFLTNRLAQMKITVSYCTVWEGCSECSVCVTVVTHHFTVENTIKTHVKIKWQ